MLRQTIPGGKVVYYEPVVRHIIVCSQSETCRKTAVNRERRNRLNLHCTPVVLTVVVDVVQAHNRLFDLNRGHGEGLLLDNRHVHNHVGLVVLVIERLVLRLESVKESKNTRDRSMV